MTNVWFEDLVTVQTTANPQREMRVRLREDENKIQQETTRTSNYSARKSLEA